MNNIKSSFTINDFENISGIKAHTIRIWEKRYQLFSPQRAGRNVRYYTLENLQKLLNVALLNNSGFKISKIAQLDENQIKLKTRELVNQKSKNNKALNSLKMAMYSFNTHAFDEVYEEQIRQKPFSDLFKDLFIPLLDFIGLLWQTDSIKPAHEHFISNLIAQKILLNIELQKNNTAVYNDTTYVFFLPEEEMHEIGILYLNYEFLLRGNKTVYLGRSIPIEDIKPLMDIYDNICFINTFTVAPKYALIENYIQNCAQLIKETPHTFCFIGKRAESFSNTHTTHQLHFFSNLTDILELF